MWTRKLPPYHPWHHLVDEAYATFLTMQLTMTIDIMQPLHFCAPPAAILQKPKSLYGLQVFNSFGQWLVEIVLGGLI